MESKENARLVFDVIVVGAGLSGLKAASELVGQGRSVLVLEAKDRVGGRVKAGIVAGRVIDQGGQWVGSRHTVLLAEAGRLGVGTYKQYASGKVQVLLHDKLKAFTGKVPPLSPLALLEMLWMQWRWTRDMKTVPKDAPWMAAKAEQWDAITLDGWITANMRSKAARTFARAIPRSAWAAEARQVSYLWFLDALRSGDGVAHLMDVEDGILDAKFKGGMHQIAAKLAAELGDRVILSAPVHHVDQDENGVTVTSAKGTHHAKHLIIAVPPGTIERIDFEPHLPAIRDGLHQRMPMGNIVKINIAYERPFWREAGFSGQVATDDDTLGIVMDDVQDTGPAVLICFIEGRHALELSAASKDERRARTIKSLVRFFGSEAANPLDYDDNDWSLEPFTHGYVGTMPPGTMTRFGPALREPVGRIHWAGTETSTEWAGYIEEAMRSGIRAAHEVGLRHNA